MSDAPETPPAPGVRERFPELYGELRQLAERMLRHRAAASLSPTELVHEAFFKLRDEESRRLRNDRSQLGQKPDESFKACFGAACRDVLGEQCRRRAALKRGGGKADVELHSTILLPGAGEVDTLGIHDAIAALAEHDRTLAELVEARVFGELSIPECAKLFDMAPRTVNRRWAFAIAWLRDRMQ